ncbi:MAG: SH3 domain-containing protein [Chitinophagales bacterium]|nr:SH3 domain-containing protein [Chitinophagales bacterium]
MLKNLIAILFALSLAETVYSQQEAYKEGDTLSVFTIGGLKLRADALLSGKVLASMKLGEKVVVQEVFLRNKQYSQTIEGFAGHWVKVKYDTLEGYAFDGFLSSLPIPRENLIKKDDRIKTQAEIEPCQREVPPRASNPSGSTRHHYRIGSQTHAGIHTF